MTVLNATSCGITLDAGHDFALPIDGDETEVALLNRRKRVPLRMGKSRIKQVEAGAGERFLRGNRQDHSESDEADGQRAQAPIHCSVESSPRTAARPAAKVYKPQRRRGHRGEVEVSLFCLLCVSEVDEGKTRGFSGTIESSIAPPPPPRTEEFKNSPRFRRARPEHPA